LVLVAILFLLHHASHMARTPRLIALSDSERASLENMIQPTMQYRYVQRAKVILMAAEGRGNSIRHRDEEEQGAPDPEEP
jgi:hypothetical protein